MKTTSLSILIVLTLLAAPVHCARRAPRAATAPGGLKAKRITHRAQITVAFRLPRKRDTSNPWPEGEPREQGHMDTTPHVSNDRWYGHDRPDDKRYHMDHGFPHGRFERFGPGYRYNIVRIDHDRWPSPKPRLQKKSAG